MKPPRSQNQDALSGAGTSVAFIIRPALSTHVRIALLKCSLTKLVINTVYMICDNAGWRSRTNCVQYSNTTSESSDRLAALGMALQLKLWSSSLNKTIKITNLAFRVSHGRQGAKRKAFNLRQGQNCCGTRGWIFKWRRRGLSFINLIRPYTDKQYGHCLSSIFYLSLKTINSSHTSPAEV